MRTLPPALLAGAAAIALAAPAMAQDVPADDRGFSGFYVGGSVGYDIQPNDVGETIEFDRNLDGRFGDTVRTAAGANAFSPGFCNGRGTAPTPATPCRNDKDGLSYSARVGIDSQFDTGLGGIVVGVVGEFGKSEINDSVTGYSTTPASYTFTRSVDWEASVRGRVGYAAGGKTLFYGTYGVGYANIDHRFATTNTANAFSERNDSKRWGALAGGGVEQRIGRNFSVGMEYMFHHYDDNSYRVRATAGSAPATNPFILAPNTTGTDFRRNYDVFRWHSLKATAAFRF
jgi:outer membrane immunogenic protein